MSTILAQARLRACRHWPFASHAILSMVPVVRPGSGTLSVDQHWRLYYDEAVLQQIGIEQSAGMILHEMDHLLKRHHKRGKFLVGNDSSKWDTWNYATDASINSDLRAQSIPLPDEVVYPERFNLPPGLSAEEYFRALSEPAQDEPDSESQDDSEEGSQPQEDGHDDQAADDSQGDETTDHGAGSPTDSEGTDDQDAQATSKGADGSSEEPSGNTDEAIEPQPIGTSGSCSDGQQRPWELGPPDEDNAGLEEADQEQLIHVTAKNVLDKDRGEGSNGQSLWAEDILNPPVDPAAKLLNLVRRYCDLTVGVGERSFRRPSRRNGDPRMALPSNVAPLPRITVIVDTSGSMGSDDLGLALGMIRKVLNSFRIRDGIKVITGDTQGQTKQLCLSNPRLIDLTGGGGTDMSKIVAEALKDRPQSQMILVCTDGWTPWPSEAPGIPVVACITNKLADLPESYKPPHWIVTLELKGD